MAELTAGAAKYQMESLDKLEAYVDEQVANSTYSLDANLALLRFYQINPPSTKVALVAKVLLKAIMQLPNPDFKACVHLLSERLQSDDTVSKVVQLANALETTRFTDFWTIAAGCKDLLASVPRFYEVVRSNMLHLMGITFQRIHKNVLGSYLQLDASELEKLIKEKASSGWSVQSSPSGDLVVFPKNQHTQVVVKRTQEVIRLEQVAPVLRSVTVGFY